MPTFCNLVGESTFGDTLPSSWCVLASLHGVWSVFSFSSVSSPLAADGSSVG